VHGLHPDDVATRVARALDGVRPYLASHGGDVELVDISDGVVRLRLTGSCDGCSSSAATLELAVEGAVHDAAPEVTGIEVEQPSAASVIPLSSLWARTGEPASAEATPGDPGHRASSWHEVPVTELATERVQSQLVAGVSVAICRVGSEFFAFRDRCPNCESTIGGAALHRRAGGQVGTAVLRCPGCGGHFDIRHAGTGIDSTHHLDPLPLLVSESTVRVAVHDVAIGMGVNGQGDA
jgi:Fe-S cluster biogenesis protein NfuA/nitrite reductase/ring-hydroxylating ferredoxin subunit